MKEKQKCKIVEDLFGLYYEQLTSETSKNMIESHLKECKSCEKKYEKYILELQEETREEKRKEEKFRGKLMRYRYQLLGMILGSVIMVVGVILSFVGVTFGIQMINGADSSTESIEDYGEFEDYAGISKLYLFPLKKELATKNVETEKYVYECSGGRLYQTCQIYLECKYINEDEYLEEKQRLKKVSCKDTEKRVRESKEEFSYPGVYAMLNEEYEYALFLEEEQKIIYVYLQGMVDRRDLKFSEKYLPLEYGQDGFDYEDKEKFSIYSLTFEELEN